MLRVLYLFSFVINVIDNQEVGFVGDLSARVCFIHIVSHEIFVTIETLVCE